MQQLPFDYSVRNLGRSRFRLGAIILGSALVVLLVLAAGSFIRGMNQSLILGGSPDNVLLLAVGSEESIERSEVPASSGALLAASVPGLKEANGVSYVSPEINVALILRPDRDSAEEWRGVIRGVTETAWLVRPQVALVSGREPRSGADEVIVGSLTAERLGIPPERLSEGEPVWFGGHAWTIVGQFQAKGTVMDAEIWAPLSDVLVALKRDTISAVTVTLDSAEFADIDAFTKQRFDLEITAVSEMDYYAGLMRFYRPVRWMIGLTALLVSFAGIFGGLNTLYSAFAARIREVGMLQCIGYTRMAVVLSLVQESVLAASTGAVLAAVVAIVFLDELAISFSLGVFALQVDGPVLLSGILAGLLLGALGAIPPAIRCLRLPVAEALKAT